jgi:radical SAM protein with 4Fe4S-binding SPASM domain
MSETVPVNVNFHEVHHSDHYYKWLESKSERYKEYRKKWSENPANFIDEGYPLNLDIEASSACNLRCPMCPRTVALKNNKMDRHSKHFDFELYKRLIDEATELGVYALKLNWLGEPLMNPRIVDMVRYAKNRGIEDVIMNTNAVLLNEKMSHDLISAGIDRLFFSFDSPNRETYEKIRVGAKYDETLTNIKRFHTIRNEMGSLSPTTRVSMVVLPQSADVLKDYVDLFGDVVDIVAYDDFIDHEKDYSYLEKHKDMRFACSYLWHRIFIGTDGEIGICCNDHNTSFGIGNIRDMTICEAWNSPKYKKLRQLHQENKWHDIDMCSRCPLVLFDESGSV